MFAASSSTGITMESTARDLFTTAWDRRCAAGRSLRRLLERAAALDRHVGERVEAVEGDAEALAELAPVIGLERRLRRRQRGPQRVVNEVEHETGVLTAVAERVEALETADGAVVDALAALPL